MADGKYILFDEGGFFFKYRLCANNGQALIISEPYKDEKACIKGIDTLKKGVEEKTLKTDFEKDKKGNWCFRLITAQGRPLAQSANYATEKAAVKASESFQRFVAAEKIEKADAASDPTHYDVQILDGAVETSDKGKFEILTDTDSFYYALKANNGQILCTSQAYSSYDSAKKAIDGFRKYVYEGKFYIFIDKKKQAFFKLYSSQLRLVMTGETYAKKDLAISAAKSVLKFAKDAKLVENK